MTSSSLKLSNQLLVGEVLKRASHRSPNQEAFVFNDQRITYRELDNRATNLAGWLQEQGVNQNDKVGFMLKNSIAFSEITFGTALSGGVAVPINFRLTGDEVAYILQDSDAKIVFIDDDYADLILSIKDQLPLVEKIVVIGNNDHPTDLIDYESIFTQKSNYLPCESLTDDDAGFIMYTSGTTGKPKGAVLSHKSLHINAMNIIAEGRSRYGESNLLAPPQFHIAGLLLTIKSVLTSGKTVLLQEFDPLKIVEIIEKEKINFMFLVPAMWNFLFQVPNISDFDLSSIKICATGAAISPVELKKRILKHFNNTILVDHFGQSETTATTTCLVGEDALRKPESIGRPFMNVEVRVVDENMNDVAIGEVGEIVYRGPTVMKEYYKNQEATKAAFQGGWFRSGDLVKMDEEGFIYVVDRKSDMIISGGENIYPAEVEEVLYQMPEILECAVFGSEDPQWGERVTAAVVVKPDHDLTEEEVIAYCEQHLANYKKPRSVEFLQKLPRNTAGKVLKYKLRENVVKEN